MAEANNINLHSNQAVAGMDMDSNLSSIKPGVVSYALNASVENFNNSSVSYQNEQGNEFCLSFPENYVLIGTYFILEKNKHLFFLVNPLTNESEIGFMDNNDCNYQTLINASCLNFNINYPIHKVAHKISNCTTEIYWTDGLNSRRYLDIENIPYILEADSLLCSPVYSKQLDCNQLKIQPNFKIPLLNVSSVTTGGTLTAGTYQFAIQYSDAASNGYTSFYSITNPTPIADVQITTTNFNYPVGKSISVEIKNLDVTGQFQHFNLVVIKTVNVISSVELIGTFFIDDVSQEITYTGQSVDNIKFSIEEVFEKFPYYDVADDLTAVQDVLVWKGLKSNERLNYQKIANKINLQWETHRIPPTENYSNELNATNLRSYLRDEIYAFEIVFLLSNGKQTDGFHIPGRSINALDVQIINSNEDFIFTEPTLPRWKVYNTATLTGFSTDYSNNINYKGPHQYGEFAYWESELLYPCNEEIWGELSNTPIRHHKFPDVLVSPIFESNMFTGIANLKMENKAVFPIGIKIDTNQIQELINNSDLTQIQKEEIVGFKIVRGDRSTNKSIVGKGILRNVGKYTKQEQSYYFPNYPYNDLGEDPFLNKINNAWTELCEPFNIHVYTLPETDELGPYLEVSYISCENNKAATIKYRNIGEQEQLCAIGKPKVISPGKSNEIFYSDGRYDSYPKIASDNIATVMYANYDIIRAYSVDSADIGGCNGWRVGWSDAMSDKTEETVWVWGQLSGSKPRTRFLYVRQGTKGFCYSNCGVCGKRGYNDEPPYDIVRSEGCKTETPLDTIESDSLLSYRQIFNSPETSFSQPFLGDVLKLESVIFGKGKGHFVEVKDNAKYKLLTEEAQRDALDICNELGNITNDFSATAMFAAYQAYLTVYINGITRKNYAYSYNSIADYNYSMAIPNDVDVKQRLLDIKTYLIPGVQSVGDDININNFQRESSVFLKTVDNKTALPFPDSSPYMLSGSDSILKDRSRMTISGSGNCATPAQETNIEVVSYYASLKNTFTTQWGQIYSYNTIDTGFQYMFNESQNSSTVFGGDTYITKFAFKTKLPFFIDNRVDAPDDSDIFFDEIGNIAYPKYWHSARSILSNYSSHGGELVNFVSYKAHEFDCHNNQEPKENNPDRTFYDGYFYLFAYGVPSFYCESSYNTDLRQAFNNKEGDFFPHVSTGIPDDWFQEKFVSIANDNSYYYNTTYSKQNKENYFTHLPPDWESKLCFTNYPFRAIYSDAQITDTDNRVNNWLTYRATSYFDFPQNYGNLVSLDGIQNRAVLARFENKSLLYDNLLTIDTSNPQAAYMGNSNMFKKSPPIDFAETDLGYVGSQNKFLLKIPQGQITIDAKRGQIFLISGTSIKDLSALGSGMNSFLTDHLPFEILKHFSNINIDNHFNGIGIHGVFDSKFNRIIISKLDYIPLNKDIIYKGEQNKFYITKKSGEYIIETEIFLTDVDYFCNKSWTLSFNLNTNSWISFHSYIPNFYIAENNFFYSGNNGCCEEFDFIASVIVSNPSTTTTTSTILPNLDCNLDASVRDLNCNLEGNATLVNFTTTTTSSSSTTTTTTTSSSDCILIEFVNNTLEILPIVIINCNGEEQTFDLLAEQTNAICLFGVVSFDQTKITATFISPCPL